MCCWSPGFAGRSCDFFPVPLQHPQTQFLPSFLLPSRVVVPSFEWMRFIGEKIFSGSAGVQLVFHSTQPLDYYFIPVANKSKQRNWGALSLSLEVRTAQKKETRQTNAIQGRPGLGLVIILWFLELPTRLGHANDIRLVTRST